jgi:hypothetical protein
MQFVKPSHPASTAASSLTAPSASAVEVDPDVEVGAEVPFESDALPVPVSRPPHAATPRMRRIPASRMTQR